MDEISQKIGAWLKKTRQSKGLTLPQLAYLAGLSHAALSRIETGASAVTLFTLVRIFHAYHYTYSAIYDDLDLPVWSPPVYSDLEVKRVVDDYPSLTLPDVEDFIRFYEKQADLASQLISRLIGTKAVQAIHKLPGSVSKEQKQELINLFDRYYDKEYAEFPPVTLYIYRCIYLSGGAITLKDMGGYLKECRLAKDVSLRQLAKEIRITAPGLGLLEKALGDRTKVVDLLNLDKALGLNGELLAFAWRTAELYTGVMRHASYTRRGNEPPIGWTDEQIRLFERLLLVSRLYQCYLPEDREWIKDFREVVQGVPR
jgi:transcriptional regulator with XRE-family HTH domain